MTDIPAPSESAPTQPVSRFQFEFTGSGREYFGIWVVNVALSIVTLGIYSAWAKVRTQRYLYGNTHLDGASFDYTANPVSILKGRLIAVTVLGLVYLMQPQQPLFNWIALSMSFEAAIGILIALSIAMVFFIPWAVMMSLRFRARVSRYRNISFDFTGRYWAAWWNTMVLPALTAITFFLYPIGVAASTRYMFNHHRYGSLQFMTPLRLMGLFGVMIIGLVLVSLIVGVFIGILVATLMPVIDALSQSGELDPNDPQVLMTAMAAAAAPFVIGYAGILIVSSWVGGWIKAHIYNKAMDGLAVGDDIRLKASLKPFSFATIVLTNMILTILTLGFFYPFAKVRLARAYAAGTGLAARRDLGEIAGEAEPVVSATGSELVDLAGWDIGF